VGGESPTQQIRIVLAEEQQLVRRGLRLLLEHEQDFEVTAEAGDADSTRRFVLGHRPDVLVTDLNMPGGSMLETIPRLRSDSPATQVVVLTMQDDPSAARIALRAGALAYVLKQAADQELRDAIRLAASGKRYLSPKLGARLVLETMRPPPDDLSARELQVLRGVALGHQDNEIADQLYLSVRTIESHRLSIRNKLGLRTRPDLVRYAIRRGLLDND
jgi:two-component system, NarL family, response regulator NreC